MTEARLFSRAELCAISRAPDDAVQFWLRQGLLQSVDRGERKHRRFDVREVKFAALLREARKFGMNVGIMREIVGRLRTALAVYDAIPRTPHLGDLLGHVSWRDDPAHGESFDQWIAGLQQISVWNLSPDDIAKMRAADAALTRENMEAVREGSSFDDADETLVIEHADDDGIIISFGLGDMGIDTASAVVFNFARLFDLDWPEGVQWKYGQS